MARNPADVRMHGFTRRTSVEDAVAWLDRQLDGIAKRPSETVPLDPAAGRVLAADVVSPIDVPQFDRAMMDGFAIRAADVAGASTYNAQPLREIGVSLPGKPHLGPMSPGDAVRIMTGAPMPAGADAVLPIEDIESLPAPSPTESSSSAATPPLPGRGTGPGGGGERGPTIRALAEVPPGKHIGRVGEDIRAGDVVLAGGRRLRPQDVGVIASIGRASVDVVCRPKVRIVVTGNELVPGGTKPVAYKIADANGPMLAALVRRDGGVSHHPGIVVDDRESIRAALHAQADIVLISGGSSCGQEDHAPTILAEEGELAIHGIAMRPSSPAGMGKLGGRLVFLLPGNPVSCLCAYDFFAGRAVRVLAGNPRDWPYRSVEAPLARKLVSQIGRTDYARVRLVDGQVHPMAISGASILSSTTRADGFVIVPAESEGYPAGALVRVRCYDEYTATPARSVQ